jgi:ELWxxDGT repeat protein
VGYTDANGSELWKSDGTESGTVMVKDITIGAEGSFFRKLTDCGNYLLFTAFDITIGKTRFWKTDGTTTGTTIITINPEPSQYRIGEIISGFELFNGVIYFTLQEPSGSPYKVYRMSYSFFGGALTAPVLINNTDNASGLCWYNLSLYFKVEDSSIPKYEFKKYDGATVSTVKTLSISFMANSSQKTIVFNAKMYFTTTDNLKGNELWQSDGTTAGTQILKDINSGGASSTPNNLFVGNNYLYFMADDGTHGNELWKTDGTAAATTLVADLNLGVGGSEISFIGRDNTIIYFQTKSSKLDLKLYKYDETNSQLTLLKDFNPLRSDSRFGGTMIGTGHTLMCIGYDLANGANIWKSDGTVGGTTLIKRTSEGNSNPSDFLSVGANTFFAAREDDSNSSKPFVSNGTTGGTIKLADVSFHSAFPNGFISVNGIVFFGATNASGTGLWRTDGTPAGTFIVKIINPNPNYPFSYPKYFCNANGTLFFSIDDGINGTELWKSDGTTTGTVMVKDIYSGSIGSEPFYLISYNNFVYFIAQDINTISLWRSDGTSAGTILIKTLNYYTNGMVIFKNKLFFVAYTATNGSELWSSDGTTVGTNLFKDINVGSNSSNPYYLTANATTLYFSADNGINGRELWKSDGTVAGTVMVKDLNVSDFGIVSSNPQNLTFVGNQLFFSCITSKPSLLSRSGYGRELWRTDGTVTNTYMVKDINPTDRVSGISDTYTNKFAGVGSYIYFPANDGNNGYELWKSNGTASGTDMVNDLFAGSLNDGLLPNTEIHVNTASSQVFFEGTNGQNGRELWSFKFCPTSLNINTTVNAPNQKQQAFTSLTSTSDIKSTSFNYGNLDVQYTAGSVMDFQPGFHVESKQLYPLITPPLYRQTVFKADIGGCSN